MQKVDGQVIETWTFRNCFLVSITEKEALMQSGRSTTEPHALVTLDDFR